MEAYAKENHLFYDGKETPNYTRVIQLDLGEINSSLAGPKRPQDRIPLGHVAENFTASLTNPSGPQGFGLPAEEIDKKVPVVNKDTEIQTGDLALAAITIVQILVTQA